MIDFKEMERTGVYDYIANNYFQLHTYELKQIALEMIWQLEQAKGNYEVACKETIKALNEDGEDE